MKIGIIISSIIFIGILVTVYIINGSDRQDAWLYIFAIGLVVMSSYEAFTKIQKPKDK